MIDAVHAAVRAGQIPRQCAFLAVELAIYANDPRPDDENDANVGGGIRPSTRTLMANTGFSESTIRHGTQVLIKSGVLAYDGYHGHVRRFRFNVASVDADGEVPLQPPTRPSQTCNGLQGSGGDFGATTLQR